MKNYRQILQVHYSLHKCSILFLNAKIIGSLLMLSFRVLQRKIPLKDGNSSPKRVSYCWCSCGQTLSATQKGKGSEYTVSAHARRHVRSGKNNFFYSGVKIWNDIPLPIRTSPTITTFKRKLKEFLQN